MHAAFDHYSYYLASIKKHPCQNDFWYLFLETKHIEFQKSQMGDKSDLVKEEEIRRVVEYFTKNVYRAKDGSSFVRFHVHSQYIEHYITNTSLS